MTLRDDLNSCTPRLRRYARALAAGTAASSSLADDLVHAALIRALGARQIGSSADLSVRLYATVTQLHRDTLVAGHEMRASGSGRPTMVSTSLAPALARQTRLSTGLMSLPLEEREALLLVALEGFDQTDAARILRISRQTLVGRLGNARRALDAHLQAQPKPTTRPTTAPIGSSRRDVPYLRLVT